MNLLEKLAVIKNRFKHAFNLFKRDVETTTNEPEKNNTRTAYTDFLDLFYNLFDQFEPYIEKYSNKKSTTFDTYDLEDGLQSINDLRAHTLIDNNLENKYLESRRIPKLKSFLTSFVEYAKISSIYDMADYPNAKEILESEIFTNPAIFKQSTKFLNINDVDSWINEYDNFIKDNRGKYGPVFDSFLSELSEIVDNIKKYISSNNSTVDISNKVAYSENTSSEILVLFDHIDKKIEEMCNEMKLYKKFTIDTDSTQFKEYYKKYPLVDNNTMFLLSREIDSLITTMGGFSSKTCYSFIKITTELYDAIEGFLFTEYPKITDIFKNQTTPSSSKQSTEDTDNMFLDGDVISPINAIFNDYLSDSIEINDDNLTLAIKIIFDYIKNFISKTYLHVGVDLKLEISDDDYNVLGGAVVDTMNIAAFHEQKNGTGTIRIYLKSLKALATVSPQHEILAKLILAVAHESGHSIFNFLSSLDLPDNLYKRTYLERIALTPQNKSKFSMSDVNTLICLSPSFRKLFMEERMGCQILTPEQFADKNIEIEYYQPKTNEAVLNDMNNFIYRAAPEEQFARNFSELFLKYFLNAYTEYYSTDESSDSTNTKQNDRKEHVKSAILKNIEKLQTKTSNLATNNLEYNELSYVDLDQAVLEDFSKFEPSPLLNLLFTDYDYAYMSVQSSESMQSSISGIFKSYIQDLPHDERIKLITYALENGNYKMLEEFIKARKESLDVSTFKREISPIDCIPAELICKYLSTDIPDPRFIARDIAAYTNTSSGIIEKCKKRNPKYAINDKAKTLLNLARKSDQQYEEIKKAFYLSLESKNLSLLIPSLVLLRNLRFRNNDLFMEIALSKETESFISSIPSLEWSIQEKLKLCSEFSMIYNLIDPRPEISFTIDDMRHNILKEHIEKKFKNSSDEKTVDPT